MYGATQVCHARFGQCSLLALLTTYFHLLALLAQVHSMTLCCRDENEESEDPDDAFQVITAQVPSGTYAHVFLVKI